MNKQEKILSTKILAEISIFVALATALSFIKIYTFPQGGSVTAGSMVPILWLALRRGPKVGLFAATVYGLVQLVVGPFIFHPAQVLLDYPLAFGALGEQATEKELLKKVLAEYPKSPEAKKAKTLLKK